MSIFQLKQLDIRNNLKLGTPSQNEFHIENELSIFFDEYKNEIFYEVEAIIYSEGQFIKSNSAEIEIAKKNFNLVFVDGERLLLNENEKSKTNFDKFTYSIENNEIEELLMDKEHFNTINLINHKNHEFVNHGHNRIYQYFLTIVIIILSFKIIFLYKPKKSLIKNFIYIFILLLFLQIFNSYLIYLLNDKILNISYYYIINVILLTIFIYFLNRINR